MHSGHPELRSSELVDALDALRRGEVVVVTREHPKPVAVLVFAAELATPEIVAFVVRHSTGFIRVAISRERAARLGLPGQVLLPVGAVEDQCVTVDAAKGISTGISAADRARTIALLSGESTTPGDLSRPGHIVPVRVARGPAADRSEFAVAAADLAGLAGLSEHAGYAELVSIQDQRELATPSEARSFAQSSGLALLGVEQLRTQTAGKMPPAVMTRTHTEHGLPVPSWAHPEDASWRDNDDMRTQDHSRTIN
jgi:3,4-dihydroxy 2-butanone 4-phosphate synthase/GTP cyclohydrolase II